MTSDQTRRAALLATCAASCIGQLPITSLNIALYQISNSLQVTTSELQWIVIAYSLPFATLLLSAGALSDRLGPKRVCAAGYVIFALASLLSAVAPDFTVLTTGRAIQGVGAALLAPSSLALLSESCGKDQGRLARSIAIWYGLGGACFAAGPIVGGALLSFTSWRSIFLLNVPVCAFGLFMLNRYRASSSSLVNSVSSPNWAGQALLLTTLISLLVTIVEYRSTRQLTLEVLIGFLFTAIGAFAFTLLERHREHRLFPVQLFTERGTALPVAFGLLIQAAFSGILFVLALYLQRALSYDPIQAGLAFIPLTVTLVFANLVSGRMVAHSGFRPPMIAGALIAAVGYLLLLRLDQYSSAWSMIPGFLLIPTGMGLTVPAVMSAMLGGAARHWSGIGSALVNAARQVGSAAGVAVFGSLIPEETPSATIDGLHIASIGAVLLLIGAAICAALIPSPTKSEVPTS
jgi:DHA2 family methylenomycin A resistance protein-like MFS transporter